MCVAIYLLNCLETRSTNKAVIYKSINLTVLGIVLNMSLSPFDLMVLHIQFSSFSFSFIILFHVLFLCLKLHYPEINL